MRKLIAEFFGTFWLVLGGCGSAVFAAGFPELGIGFIGVAFAFGLTVLTMAYAVGHISGGHFNPAVTLGLVAGGRFNPKDAATYIVAQVVGAIAGAACLYLILKGGPNLEAVMASGFAANGYGDLSPGKYDMASVFLAESLLTCFFVFIIMGATDRFANGKFAGIAIGLALTLIHLISIPISNTSVNPARSTSQAIFAGGGYISELWLFWVAPILGGVIGGLLYRNILQARPEEEV